MSNRDYSIAVLLPTRSRTHKLLQSLTSLIDHAHDGNSIHFVLGFDRDDKQGLDGFRDQVQPYLQQQSAKFTALTFEPMGYENLNRYYNSLAQHARADWLFVWNDDAVMQTRNWDSEIQKYNGRFLLLKVHTHNEHPYSIFPIVPREWLDVLGHLSEHQMIDAELSQSAFCLDIMQVIDVHVAHNQIELTNDKQDALGVKRRFEGNPYHPRDFHNQAVSVRRWNNKQKLADHMQKQGVSLEFWQAVLAGRQDPWQKLKELDINHQMVQFDVNGRTTSTQTSKAQTNV